MTIYATSRPDPTFESDHKQCVRCGIIRNARANAKLCTDCRHSMTRRELGIWCNA